MFDRRLKCVVLLILTIALFCSFSRVALAGLSSTMTISTFGAIIQNDPENNRDSDDYIVYQWDTSENEWTLTPAKIYYRVHPENPEGISFSPTKVTLYLKKGETLIKTIPLEAKTGDGKIVWDGTDETGNLVAPGTYTAEIEVEYAGKKARSREHRITVFKVERVTLNSPYALQSPVDFEGDKYILGDPCVATNPEHSLIIPHKNVRTETSAVINFSVGTKAFLLPQGIELPEELKNLDKWSKVAGPSSGEFKNLKDLDNKYQNPNQGGVYELQFKVLESKTKALLHLPLGGPHAESWVEEQRDKLNNVAAIIATMNPGKATICYMATSATMFWNGEAIQSGRSPCHVFGQNETITIYRVIIGDPKFQNFMWGYYCRIFYPEDIRWRVQVFLAGFVGTPDTPECREAYWAGKEWRDGDNLETVMKRRGLKMQVKGELEEKLWPSSDPYIGGRQGPDFLNMSESELIEYSFDVLRIPRLRPR